MVPNTGVILNNEMNDFSIPNVSNAFGFVPSSSNYIVPGKRPLSSISTAVVERISDSSLYFVVAASGGSRIITAVIQALWYILDQGCDLERAVAKPRLHDQLIPNTVQFEHAYDNSTVTFMRGRGHNVTWITVVQSLLMAIRRIDNVLSRQLPTHAL